MKLFTFSKRQDVDPDDTRAACEFIAEHAREHGLYATRFGGDLLYNAERKLRAEYYRYLKGGTITVRTHSQKVG